MIPDRSSSMISIIILIIIIPEHSSLSLRIALIILIIMIPDYIAVEQWATVRLPPNATNKQTARDRDGLVPEVCCSHT